MHPSSGRSVRLPEGRALAAMHKQAGWWITGAPFIGAASAQAMAQLRLLPRACSVRPKLRHACKEFLSKRLRARTSASRVGTSIVSGTQCTPH
jgi:hypothetical protein